MLKLVSDRCPENFRLLISPMHRIQSCVDVCFHTFKKFFLLFPFDPFTSSAETVGLTLGWLVVLDLLPGILLLLEVILWWLSSTLEFEQRGRDLTTASPTMPRFGHFKPQTVQIIQLKLSEKTAKRVILMPNCSSYDS